MSDQIIPTNLTKTSIKPFVSKIIKTKSLEENNKFNLMFSAQVKVLKEAQKAATSLEDLEKILKQLQLMGRLYTEHSYELSINFKSRQGRRQNKQLPPPGGESLLAKKAAKRAERQRGYFKNITREEFYKRMDKVEEAGLICTPKTISMFKNGRFQNNTRDNDQWFTPPAILERARCTMGGTIDLDPASNEIAQRNVQAKKYFTKEDDGLSKKWEGNVWLNPPYSQPLMNHFCNKLLAELPNIRQAMLLSHNHLDTNWAQALLKRADVVINFHGRINFLNSSGERAKGSSQYGQTLFSFKVCPIRFTSFFKGLGHIRYNPSVWWPMQRHKTHQMVAKFMKKHPKFKA